MGNRSKDENAATSSEARDQESRDATLARIIAEADQVHRRGSFKTKDRRNTGTHRCIPKADGGDMCTV